MQSKFFMIGLVSAAALSMAACNQAGDKPADATGAAGGTAAASGALEGPATGLWKITTAMDGAAGAAVGEIPAQEVCVTESKLENPPANPSPGAECTSTPFADQGGAKVSTASCKLPGNMTTESTIRVSGDFSKKYTTEITTTMNPAPTPEMAQTKMTMTAERLGDCPAA